MERLRVYLSDLLHRYCLTLAVFAVTAFIGIAAIWMTLERNQFIAQIKEEIIYMENSLIAAGYDIAYDDLSFSHISPWQVLRIKNLKIYSLDKDNYWQWECREFAVSANFFDINKIQLHFSAAQSLQIGRREWEMTVAQTIAEATITPEGKFKDFNLQIADLTIEKLLTVEKIKFAAQRMTPKQINENSPFLETYLDIRHLQISDYTAWPMSKHIDHLYLNANIIGTIEPQSLFSESIYTWIENGGLIEIRKFIINWKPLVMVAKGDLYFNENLVPNLNLNTSSLALVNTLDQMNANGWLEDKGVFVAKILLNNKSFKKNQGDNYYTVTTPIKLNDKQILIENIPVKKWSKENSADVLKTTAQ